MDRYDILRGLLPPLSEGNTETPKIARDSSSEVRSDSHSPITLGPMEIRPSNLMHFNFDGTNFLETEIPHHALRVRASHGTDFLLVNSDASFSGTVHVRSPLEKTHAVNKDYMESYIKRMRKEQWIFLHFPLMFTGIALILLIIFLGVR